MDIGVAYRGLGSVDGAAAEFVTGIPEEMRATIALKVPAVTAR